MADCPLCQRLETGDPHLANDRAAAIPDAYPMSPGHMLVVSRRHQTSYFALSADEQGALWGLVREVREALDRVHQPAGYNLGINEGAAAGQTVPHVHIHVIPRYAGDVADPRGGIRWILGEKAAYWDWPDDAA